MKKILIEIRGGSFQRAITEEPIEIVVVDYDKQALDDRFVHIFEPDAIRNVTNTFQDYYSNEYSDEAEVREELKRLKL